MKDLNRRTFLISVAAVGAARVVPFVPQALRQKRILTLVYDKSLGMMRAIDRIVP